jgi:NAD+ diphosphatase
VSARPALSRSAVDRDAATREDDAALAGAWERALVLVVDDGKALVDGTRLVLVEPDLAPVGDRFYLGSEAGQAYFAVPGPLPRRLGTTAQGLREVGAALDDRDAGLLTHAVGLANWHAAHPRCPLCGAATASAKGGSVRVCEADGSTHFPRTDPAVIVLITDGADRAVLGRSPAWPPRRYSTLAGFVEPGESAEQAVVREVGEEAGIDVREVVYRGSQPWPFPASLMLGYRAVCAPDARPVPQDGELEDARWFTRDELRDAGGWQGGSGPVLLPPPVSIAHRLITDWVTEVPGGAAAARSAGPSRGARR